MRAPASCVPWSTQTTPSGLAGSSSQTRAAPFAYHMAFFAKLSRGELKEASSGAAQEGGAERLARYSLSLRQTRVAEGVEHRD